MLKPIFRSCTTMLLGTALLMWGSLAHASLSIQFAEPQWTFLLNNTPLRETQAQLKPEERAFAKTIQPLLAEGQYQKVISAFSKRKLEGDSPALQLLRGQVLLTLKRPKEAKVALNVAITQMPDLALAHRALSLIYLQQADYPQAQTHLTRALELGAIDAQLYAQMAYSNLQLNQPASAVAGYRNALLLQPQNRQWQDGLLYAFIRSQAWSQASALLTEMLAAHPKDAHLWLQRAQIALKQQHYTQAISSLEMALTYGDTSTTNGAQLAQLHMEHGSPARAVAILTQQMGQFVRATSTEQQPVYSTIARWLIIKQEWALLTKLLREVDKHKSKLTATQQSQLAGYRATMLLEKGQKKHAQTQLARALKLDATNGYALIVMAELLRSLNRPEQAALYYQRAEAMPEFRHRAQLGHAQLAINQRDYPQALQLLRKAHKHHPERHDLAANIRSLEQLIRQQE